MPPAEILRRFTSEGVLDETFGMSGHVALAVSANQWGQVLRAWSTGYVGVLGSAAVDAGSGSFAAVMTQGDSGVDGGFAATPAIATFSGPFETGIWQDNRSGFLMGPQSTVRFDASGEVDVAYGAGGQLRGADTGALGPDGKLWTASGTRVRRYLADGSVDGAFGRMGVVDLPSVSAGVTIRCVVVSESGALLVGSYFSNLMTYVDVAHLGADGTVDTAFDATPSVPADEGPVGAASEASGRTWVWTAGGSLIAYAADGSLEGVSTLDVAGTVLAATLDAAGRLIVVGIDSSDTQSSRWFVQRYILF